MPLALYGITDTKKVEISKVSHHKFVICKRYHIIYLKNSNISTHTVRKEFEILDWAFLNSRRICTISSRHYFLRLLTYAETYLIDPQHVLAFPFSRCSLPHWIEQKISLPPQDFYLSRFTRRISGFCFLLRLFIPCLHFHSLSSFFFKSSICDFLFFKLICLLFQIDVKGQTVRHDLAVLLFSLLFFIRFLYFILISSKSIYF